MSAAPRRLAAVTMPVSPEAELRELFRRESENAREAVEIRRSIAAARRRLADRDGLIGFPSIDTLRREYGQ